MLYIDQCSKQAEKTLGKIIKLIKKPLNKSLMRNEIEKYKDIQRKSSDYIEEFKIIEGILYIHENIEFTQEIKKKFGVGSTKDLIKTKEQLYETKINK
jgi:hypothetical protein